jgi:hypothetical protein
MHAYEYYRRSHRWVLPVAGQIIVGQVIVGFILILIIIKLEGAESSFRHCTLVKW